MRIYISADMEGASGIVHEAQTEPGAREYERACQLMIGDVNAAIEGAFAAGASSVLVNDSHWEMRNLKIEDLHPKAELISGTPKPLSMVEGLDRSFNLVFLVGYHAMSGTGQASIDHTYSDAIHHVTINGQAVGELGINALFAGSLGVPVGLVTGDQAVSAEAQELIPGVVTVQVKQALSRTAARLLPLAEARQRIREGAMQALKTNVKPLIPEKPTILEVTLMKASQADKAELTPGTQRIGGRTLRFIHEDYREVFRAWRAIYNLAGD